MRASTSTSSESAAWTAAFVRWRTARLSSRRRCGGRPADSVRPTVSHRGGAGGGDVGRSHGCQMFGVLGPSGFSRGPSAGECRDHSVVGSEQLLLADRDCLSDLVVGIGGRDERDRPAGAPGHQPRGGAAPVRAPRRRVSTASSAAKEDMQALSGTELSLPQDPEPAKLNNGPLWREECPPWTT